MFEGLTGIFVWPAFGLLLLGILIGWFVGLLPGIGSIVALALMIPFTFNMSPIEAFSFLLGMFVVTTNAGEITAILFGVPGEATTAATILDGHPMTKKGEAGRAMGASLMSSIIGAIIGAATLAALIPVVRPLVLSFAAPELFALTILGVTFIASLSGDNLFKGVLMAGFGFMLTAVGQDGQSGVLRYTFGQLYLWDGIGLIPVAVGMFAVPEIMDLFVRGTSLAEAKVGKLGGVMEGVKDAFRHIGLVVRAGAMSAFIGLIPGLGGAVAQWVTYGHAVQSAKDKSMFGHGDVRGVLAPGASSNAKEGGALVPTVAFGVPGSLAMAILLGAFLIVGLQPGPNMLEENLHVTWSLVFIVLFATFISCGLAFLFLGQMVKITYVKGTILIPFLTLLIWMGAYTATNNFGDLVSVFLFGMLGFILVKLDWPRPPLILGLVLGGLTEKYLFIATQRYGIMLFARPVVIVVLILTLAALVYSVMQAKSMRKERLRREQVQREALDA
ncbi:MAG: TctA family transporter [Chloroflexi bacterium]|nr:MAG: TctA family transporter [Chloroflexota bacterium]